MGKKGRRKLITKFNIVSKSLYGVEICMQEQFPFRSKL